MIYLASPYTDQSADIRASRYKAVSLVAYELNKAGIPIISPISHWHPVAVDHDLPTDSDTWATINKGWLAQSSCVAILCLPGWTDSRGVMLEIDWANELSLPIVLLREKEKEKWIERLKRHLP